jgi:hypothetical protein
MGIRTSTYWASGIKPNGSLDLNLIEFIKIRSGKKWVSAEKNVTKISPGKKWVCTKKMLLIKLVLV